MLWEEYFGDSHLYMVELSSSSPKLPFFRDMEGGCLQGTNEISHLKKKRRRKNKKSFTPRTFFVIISGGSFLFLYSKKKV